TAMRRRKEQASGASPCGRVGRDAGGFTLIETLVAATIVLTGLFTMASSIVRSKMTRLEAEQQITANAALRRTAATLHALGRTSAYQTYAPSHCGAPFPAKGSGPGAQFLANGLADASNPASAASVEIQFFTNETANVPQLGLPRDLDGDGVVDNADTSALGADGLLVATTLPYLLSITYRGPGGGATTSTCRGVLTRVR